MNITPKKSLGQNFLLNKKIIKDIVELGQVSNQNTIIEIGPGTGNLTEELLKKKPKRFFAIEKDKDLYNKLKNRFGSNLELINQDILKIDWDNFNYDNILVFGNLPYNISAKLLVNILNIENLNTKFKKLVFMFQKEVADRIVANVNSKKYGRLTILTAWKMIAKKIMDVEPENFFPKPKVKSSILVLKPKSNFFFFKNPKNLENVTDVFFQNRRKMIKKPLNILFKDSKKVIRNLELDEKCRPQNLDVSTFLKISKEFENQ